VGDGLSPPFLSAALITQASLFSKQVLGDREGKRASGLKQRQNNSNHSHFGVGNFQVSRLYSEINAAP
jgi:hypothetical protein